LADLSRKAYPPDAEHAQVIIAARHDPELSTERATERVAVLMTPTQKAAYDCRNPQAETRALAEEEFLEAALKQLEFSTSRTERILDAALAEVRAALSA